jgi:hypothetical protein
MSSSDPLKAKRFVELRKKKLHHLRTVLKPPVVEVVEEENSQQQNEGGDSISNGSTSTSGGGGRTRPSKAMPLTFKQKAAIADRHNQHQDQDQDGQTDPMIIIETSSSMSSLCAPPAPPAPVIPSTHIRNCFLRASIAHAASSITSSEEYDEDGSRSGSSSNSTNTAHTEKSETGRSQLQRAIEERAAQASKLLGHDSDDDDDENNNNSSSGPFQKKKDLRSIYQQYLDGNVEKESVVRSGKQWTKSYRTRRIQYCPRQRTPFQETQDQQI